MGYTRSAPTFSFSGADKLNRTVTVFPDLEDRAAQIGPRSRRRRPLGETVSMTVAEFRADRPTARLG